MDEYNFKQGMFKNIKTPMMINNVCIKLLHVLEPKYMS